MHRLLKGHSFCLNFFTKQHNASVSLLRHRHEEAYLLVKGSVDKPPLPPREVVEIPNTANRLHPTQKAAKVLRPFVERFRPRGRAQPEVSITKTSYLNPFSCQLAVVLFHRRGARFLALVRGSRRSPPLAVMDRRCNQG